MAPVSIAACLSDRRYRLIYQLSGPLRLPALELEADDPVQPMSDWAAGHALDEVVAFAPIVGPLRDLLSRLGTQLGSRGIRLILIRRASDQHVFPLAKPGFFHSGKN